MTRSDILYADGGDWTAPEGHVSYKVDEPTPGFYRCKMRFDGLPVGVRIWHGLPNDPVTGEPLDRSPRWQADVNGTYAEIETVWPRCARDPIGEDEYLHLCRLTGWAQDHAPDSALADPRRKVDPLSMPLPF